MEVDGRGVSKSYPNIVTPIGLLSAHYNHRHPDNAGIFFTTHRKSRCASIRIKACYSPEPDSHPCSIQFYQKCAIGVKRIFIKNLFEMKNLVVMIES